MDLRMSVDKYQERKNKILALPAPQTLHRYIDKVKGVYTF